MGDFHFLRPWWLLLLPAGVFLVAVLMRSFRDAGRWTRFVDRPLQPFVLSAAGQGAGRFWIWFAAIAALVVATLALAGPTWERMQVPVFRSDQAVVVALDLSRSMNATDLAPSRLVRARLKLRALLERRDTGQTGLVVFSANAFTVTPLTTDTHTIAALLPVLTTDIMPSQGTNLVVGMKKAAALLHQAHVSRGEILLITDAPVSREAVREADALSDADVTVNVLGVGTAQGAPIPVAGGGFIRDRTGKLVVPKLDVDGLRRLAAAGGGRFARITADNRDLERLLPSAGADMLQRAGQSDRQHEVDIWSDAGRWLVLILLPLMAVSFRRGWLCLWLLCFLVPVPRLHAQPVVPEPVASSSASDQAGPDSSFWISAWQSLWQRPDQRGAEALMEHRPVDAARLFDNPAWRAAAQYKAGEYDASVASLAKLDSGSADYNRGNALARSGRLKAAVRSYDRALKLDPDNQDALYNRALVQRLLEQRNAKGSEASKSAAKSQAHPQSGKSFRKQRDSGNGSGSGSAGRPMKGGRSSPPDNQAAPGKRADGHQQRPTDGRRRGRSPSDTTDAPSKGSSDQATQAQPRGSSTKAGPQGNDAKSRSSGPENVRDWVSRQAAEQWLRRIPQDPGGLLRRKFRYQYRRLGVDQDGHRIRSSDQGQSW